MYSRILFVVGVVFLLQACTRPSGRQQIEENFKEMTSEIQKQSLEDSWKTLDTFEAKVTEVRKSKPRQSEDDEIYLDRLMFGLKEIPRGTKMTEEQCVKLSAKMISDFDPTSTPDNRHPALSKALDVLDTLCEKK